MAMLIFGRLYCVQFWLKCWYQWHGLLRFNGVAAMDWMKERQQITQTGRNAWWHDDCFRLCYYHGNQIEIEIAQADCPMWHLPIYVLFLLDTPPEQKSPLHQETLTIQRWSMLSQLLSFLCCKVPINWGPIQNRISRRVYIINTASEGVYPSSSSALLSVTMGDVHCFAMGAQKCCGSSLVQMLYEKRKSNELNTNRYWWFK